MTLPDDELASLRATHAALLSDTCTIQTATETNTKGSVSLSYANTYTGVACLLAGVNYRESERAIGAKLSSAVTHVLTVAHDQALSAKDRVVHSGTTYEVVVVQNIGATFRTARRAYLTRLE